MPGCFKRVFSCITLVGAFLTVMSTSFAADISSFTPGNWTPVAPGVWKSTFGTDTGVTLLEITGVPPADEASALMGRAGFPPNHSPEKDDVRVMSSFIMAGERK